jgi:transposase
MYYSYMNLTKRTDKVIENRDVIEKRVTRMLPLLDEKQKRIFLALEAESIGYGGVKLIHEITGVSQTTIIKGKKELELGEISPDVRIRKKGGGRKRITQKYEDIVDEIEKIVANDTYGDPERVLTWTTKSLRNITTVLQEKGYEISHDTVGNILKEMDYSLQQNQKQLQHGEPHPDRNEQFKYINKKCYEFIEQGLPVISVDTKKKELIGNFKNGGAEYSKKGEPVKTLAHDFLIKKLGKVAPYGIYDVSRNEGFVNLGISSDTSEFAVESILRWYQTVGVNTYPSAKELYITCDNGGSNGSTRKLWKKQLQEMANITGLSIHVSHFPSGTSKWNKIEHRMFCFISKNWRGQPLVTIETVVNLISSTTTSKGLKVVCIVDKNKYELGIKVTDEELAAINIVRDDFHGDWNYVIHPIE